MAFGDTELPVPGMEPERETASRDASFRISDLPAMENVATILDEQRLTEIGNLVWDEYDIDKRSRADKEEEWKAASAAFGIKREPKDHPWQNASNVKFPLLLTAAIQFQSRAMPAVVHDGKVAKGKVVGDDPMGQKQEKADRVAGYLNYQLLDKDDAWTVEMDKGLLQLPIYGDIFKKVYRADKGNSSDLVSVWDFVVNVAYPSLERAPRYTHRFDLYPNEIEERKRDGRYLKTDLVNAESLPTDDSKNKDVPAQVSDDKSRPHEFIEQHRGLDLDEDDYEEPYIVTVHVPSKKVVRIVTAYDVNDIKLTADGSGVASITRRPCFVQYPFIPDPEGGFYNIGFGRLLMDPVETINSVLNQLIDAGTLQNAGGGFIGKEFRLKAGEHRVQPGVYKQTTFSGDDIRKSIYHMEHGGPSSTLFQLLGFLVEMAKEITSVQEVLTGDAPANQPASTTLALIEQGLKVFTGIIGRVLRSLGQELKVMADLNWRYMAQDQSEYFAYGDSPKHVMQQDFDKASCDAAPVADATVVTDMQKMARAQFIREFLGPQGDDPYIEPLEARRRIFTAAGIPIEGLLREPPPPPEAQLEAMKAELDKLKADTQKAIADAMKAMAEAEATGQQVEIDKVKAAFDGVSKLMTASKPDEPSDQGAVRGVAGEPGNSVGAPSPEELQPLIAGAMAGPGMGSELPFPGGAGIPVQPQGPLPPSGGIVPVGF